MNHEGKMTACQVTKVRFIGKASRGTTLKGKKSVDKGKQTMVKKDTMGTHQSGTTNDVVEADQPERGNSATRIEELKKAFALFDQNSDGSINKEEVMEALSCAGVNFTAKQLNCFMAKMDKDGNGEVDYEEFCSLMKDSVISTTKQREGATKAFNAIDVNRDGTITKAELRDAIIQLGGSMTDSEADDVMAVADKNGDGEIDYEEFVTLVYLLDLQPSTDSSEI